MSSYRPFGIELFLVLYKTEDEPNTRDDVSCLEIFLWKNASIRTFSSKSIASTADGGGTKEA